MPIEKLKSSRVITTILESEQYEALRVGAFKKRTSIAALIREAVRKFLNDAVIISVHLGTKRRKERLLRAAKEEGVGPGEILRRAITEFLESWTERSKTAVS